MRKFAPRAFYLVQRERNMKSVLVNMMHMMLMDEIKFFGVEEKFHVYRKLLKVYILLMTIPGAA